MVHSYSQAAMVGGLQCLITDRQRLDTHMPGRWQAAGFHLVKGLKSRIQSWLGLDSYFFPSRITDGMLRPADEYFFAFI